MKIDLNNIPTFSIDCGRLHNASEIKQLMKKYDVKYYCYMFIHKSTTMKIGMSADSDWIRGSYGERIYRQAFHIPGWPTAPSPKSAGNDMLDIIENFAGINKNDVLIKVFDMTNYPFICEDIPEYEVGELEKDLMDLYEQEHGCLPVGNIRDERKLPRKSVVADVTFKRLFDSD
jgi:hypothetical protein